MTQQMTVEAPENKSEDFKLLPFNLEEHTIKSAPWYIDDSLLKSDLDNTVVYIDTVPENSFKWFNFDIKTPPETETEAAEREQATKQQIAMGILRVIQQPQQTKSVPGLQPPEQVLSQDHIQGLGIHLTQAFISTWRGQEVPTDKLMTTSPDAVVNEPQTKVEQTPMVFTKPTQPSIMDDMFAAVAKNNKYSFALNGSKKKIGRNELCPCGSLKKAKYCHLR